MSDAYLYQQIAAAIRQEILSGKLQPGARLPSVRRMKEQWNCTIGTVQRAYRELAEEGLVTSRAGQGTRVAESVPAETAPLRRAALVHRAEAFLLEVLTAGYEPDEVEDAIRQALDRWRVVTRQSPAAPARTLRFAGSHDLAIAWLASHFATLAPGYHLQLSLTGSLGGLIAVAEGEAELAGCHLWDAESDSYNLPYVLRLLPGRRVALVTLAHRKLGWILPPGNPLGIHTLEDLARPGVKLANRQPWSGTRVWLDAQLRLKGLDPARISGYAQEKNTHLEVAQAVAAGTANLGLGLEAAARSYHLDFILLTLERYELVMPEETFNLEPVQSLLAWLRSARGKEMLSQLGGYDPRATGAVRWAG